MKQVFFKANKKNVTLDSDTPLQNQTSLKTNLRIFSDLSVRIRI